MCRKFGWGALYCDDVMWIFSCSFSRPSTNKRFSFGHWILANKSQVGIPRDSFNRVERKWPPVACGIPILCSFTSFPNRIFALVVRVFVLVPPGSTFETLKSNRKECFSGGWVGLRALSKIEGCNRGRYWDSSRLIIGEDCHAWGLTRCNYSAMNPLPSVNVGSARNLLWNQLLMRIRVDHFAIAAFLTIN